MTFKKSFPSEKITVDGYEASLEGFGATKLTSDHALIYVKPCKNFWGLEHSPMICWKGSGYELRKEQIKILHGIECYTAELVKGKDKLYTLWWYRNHQQNTISQMDWRLAMANGAEAFQLVNISAETEQELEQEMAKFIKKTIKRI